MTPKEPLKEHEQFEAPGETAERSAARARLVNIKDLDIPSLIKISSDAAAKSAVQTMVWAREAQVREWPVYDYEKVFWNSTFSVGLVGLVYVSIKMGQFLRSAFATLDEVERFFFDQPNYAQGKQYRTVLEYVEGRLKDEPVPSPPTAAGMMYAAIRRYKENPEAYAAFKAKFREQNPDVAAKIESEIGLTRDPETGEEIIVSPGDYPDLLDMADGFFKKFGHLAPLACVGGHAALEWFRIKKLKKGKQG